MGVKKVRTPTSRVLFGFAREVVNQPVGIFHPMWGAAKHYRATGIHRSLFADVIALRPLEGAPEETVIRMHLDIVGLTRGQYQRFQSAIGQVSGLPHDRIVLCSSHTHATALFAPDRLAKPGGELIPAYLDQLERHIRRATQRALQNMQEVVITYAVGRCQLAVNRDYWDDEFGGYTCGYNPLGPADDTVVVARVTDEGGGLVATIVNYGCHPTTLAWENTLLSPDYIGAMREEVSRVTGAPCIFALGACGELAPRHGYVGDVEIADKNGRQLAYAVLSALESMGPPLHDFEYDGPVVSGATLGVWSYKPLSPERLEQVSLFDWRSDLVPLPLKPLPRKEELISQIAEFEEKAREAAERGDAIASRDFGAYAERARRWLARIQELPEGPTYPLRVTLARLGDAIWITSGGEPYSILQTELRRRFPEFTLIISGLSGDWAASYLLPQDRYGKGLYQEEPSPLGPGCLEAVIEHLAGRVKEILGVKPSTADLERAQ